MNLEEIYLADSFEELLDILDNMEQNEKVQKARNITSHAFTHIADDEEDEELHNIKEQILEILEERRKMGVK